MREAENPVPKVHETKCPNTPKLMQRTWRVPGELLVLSQHWKSKESGLQHQQRMAQQQQCQ